jgi:hypothetical protein
MEIQSPGSFSLIYTVLVEVHSDYINNINSFEVMFLVFVFEFNN